MSSPLLNTPLDNQQSQGVNPPQNPNPHTNPASPSAILSETKQIAKIEEGSGSDSGNDVRSPGSHHDSQTQLNNSSGQQQTVNNSSASPSNQSAGSSGFGDHVGSLAPANTPPSTISVPFFAPYSSSTSTSTPTSSSASNHFYPNQYYPTTLDMVNYQQYTQNIYANQGDF